MRRVPPSSPNHQLAQTKDHSSIRNIWFMLQESAVNPPRPNSNSRHSRKSTCGRKQLLKNPIRPKKLRRNQLLKNPILKKALRIKQLLRNLLPTKQNQRKKLLPDRDLLKHRFEEVMTDNTLIVSPEWLATNTENPEVVIIDCRFSLADFDSGKKQYQESHIPGAFYLDLNRDLASSVGKHGGDIRCQILKN